MLFNFHLFPFSELMTEIDYREALTEEWVRRQVGWYVLSDGWYSINVEIPSSFAIPNKPMIYYSHLGVLTNGTWIIS